jgi:crotonobetainyl-CoA:carnitine CoA-transferase CaiB-like acyl-CoA transferase
MILRHRYRLLDMAWFGPGPFCARLLGDLGFDVIKITDVDTGRRPAPPMLFHEQAERHADVSFRHANARSMQLNLKTEAGQEVFARLLATADAMQEGFRPGAADRLGAGYHRAREIKPDIVYASLTGYGQTGPYRDRAGHDLNYLSVAGVIAMNGRRGEPPAIPAAVLGDYAAGGMSAAIHLLAALLRRERTGEGAYCDVSMTDASLALNALVVDEFLATGLEPRRGETLTSGFWPWYGVYETRDGKYVSVAAIEPAFYRALCGVIGRDDLADEQRSLERRDKTREEFAEIFRSRTRDEWVAAFADVDACFAPVNDIVDTVGDPQLRARGMIAPAAHPRHGDILAIGSPLRFDGETSAPQSWISEPGEHTAEVLTELGYGADDVASLRGAGVIN